MKKFIVNLNEILFSFSLLLDVAEGKPFQHTKKVAYIAMEIVKGINKLELLQFAFQGAILHDIGVTHSLLMQGRSGFISAELTNMEHHASTGYEVAKELPLDYEVAKIIKYHHERWDGSGVFGLKGEEIPLLSQVIYLADQLELRFDGSKDSHAYRSEIKKWLEGEKGKGFKEELVDVALEILKREKLWIDLATYDIQPSLKEILPNKLAEINITEIEQMAKAFSIIIDKKSAYTHQHSKGVSEKAYLVAKAMGYDDEKSIKIKIAGYLHDLGKLVVPNNILDKPGRLEAEEMLVIRKHSYYTKFILKQIHGFSDIAQWAGNHHENLIGTGYPEGINQKQITEEDQIIALCDIYQALTEDRTYRKGMENEKALKILGKLVSEGLYASYLYETLCRIIS